MKYPSIQKALRFIELNSVQHSIALNDTIGRLRFVFFKWFTFFLTLSTIAVTIDLKMTVNSPLAFVFPILSLLFYVNYFLLALHRNVRLAYIVLVSMLFLEIHTDCYYAGGVNDSATFFNAVLIIGTFMLLGTRFGLAFTVLAISNQIYFYYISEHTSWVTDYLAIAGPSAVRQDYMIVGSIALVAAAGMLRNYEKSKNILLNDLNRSRRELFEKNEKLMQSEEQLKSYLKLMKENNQELERKNYDLDRFAYMVTHDLKSPLRNISSMAAFIEEDAAGKLSGQTVNYLQKMRGRISKMEALITDILAYSKATQGSKSFSEFTFDQLVQEVIDIIHLPANCKIQVYGGASVVVTDKTRLSQLILNLVVNAIKHNHRETVEITLSLTATGQHWRFEIKDNGPGIATTDQERIFQIFQKLDKKEDSGNSGIGLAIVKKIIDDLHGKIWVESTVGNGAAFIFLLPKEISDISQTSVPDSTRSVN